MLGGAAVCGRGGGGRRTPIVPKSFSPSVKSKSRDARSLPLSLTPSRHRPEGGGENKADQRWGAIWNDPLGSVVADAGTPAPEPSSSSTSILASAIGWAVSASTTLPRTAGRRVRTHPAEQSASIR